MSVTTFQSSVFADLTADSLPVQAPVLKPYVHKALDSIPIECMRR